MAYGVIKTSKAQVTGQITITASVPSEEDTVGTPISITVKTTDSSGNIVPNYPVYAFITPAPQSSSVTPEPWDILFSSSTGSDGILVYNYVPQAQGIYDITFSDSPSTVDLPSPPPIGATTENIVVIHVNPV